MRKTLKSYGLFFVSVLIIGTAITIITNAGLGATAVTSLPFVISELWPVSFGLMTGLFNVLWVVLQIAIQRKSFPKVQLLQFGVSFVLGVAIDLSNVLLGFVQPQTYFWQMVMLIIGCMVMGFGIFVQRTIESSLYSSKGIFGIFSNHRHNSFSRVVNRFRL